MFVLRKLRRILLRYRPIKFCFLFMALIYGAMWMFQSVRKLVQPLLVKGILTHGLIHNEHRMALHNNYAFLGAIHSLSDLTSVVIDTNTPPSGTNTVSGILSADNVGAEDWGDLNVTKDGNRRNMFRNTSPPATKEQMSKKVTLSVPNELGFDVFPIRVYGIVSEKILLSNGSLELHYQWEGSRYFKGCRYNNCMCTENHDQASVVIVEMMALDKGMGPQPLPRLDGQLWIAYTWEAPPYMRADFWKKLENQFHLTASYQLNADIHVPYGSFVKRASLTEGPRVHATEADIRNKTKLVAWFVSNCGGQSDRRRYADELRKYIQVDIYGNCGNLSCVTAFHKSTGRIHPCRQMLLSEYKFYLAFENSICTDYNTEKVWNQIALVVPIVLGASNYTRQLPPHSFINVRDFRSAKKLAEYLLYLDNHHEEYAKYYEWIKTYEARYSRQSDTWRCKLCEYLNTHNFTKRQLDEPKVNFDSLANVTYSCQNTDQFYSNILRD